MYLNYIHTDHSFFFLTVINMKNDKSYELSTRRQRAKVVTEIFETERSYVTGTFLVSVLNEKLPYLCFSC